MTAAHAQPLRCPGCAATPEQAAHHDRLLRIDVDPDQLLALFEMAVTWYELDYSRCDVLSPADWGRLSSDQADSGGDVRSLGSRG